MIKLRLTVALAGAIVVAAVLALGSTASAKGKTATVDVDDDFFDPIALTVKEDTKVEWNWVGDSVHDVTSGPNNPGRFFESGPQQGSGVLYSKRFRKPGNYLIICTLHEEMRMDLKVKRRRN